MAPLFIRKLKRIAILGVTGSIGKSTIDVVERFSDRLQVVAVTAKSNVIDLAQIAKRLNVKLAIITDDEHYVTLKNELTGTGIKVEAGKEALLNCCSRDDVDVVLNSLVGASGVEPTLVALKHTKIVALANKESLVCAGHLMTQEATKRNVKIFPVDSEHSAIFQVLLGEESKNIQSFILTASGGPFRDTERTEFPTITPEQALKHPTWVMGKKVTIDSATLVNKGLELIEAKWLFDANPEQLSVVIHPQSIIHSMVLFQDGSIKAQLSTPDMRLPIQFALSYPDRWKFNCVSNDFLLNGHLTFQQLDHQKFPAPSIAIQALKSSNGMPAVFNAADEIAVPAFLSGKIKFHQITELIEKAMNSFDGYVCNTLEEFLDLDNRVRRKCLQWL